MKFLLIIVLLLLFSKTYSQIANHSIGDYYNINSCDRYTILNWDLSKPEDLNIRKISGKISLIPFINFKDTLNDTILIKNIKSNIFINGVLSYFPDCFENDCSCHYNLTNVIKVYSNNMMIIKILGYFNPNPSVLSLIVLLREPENLLSNEIEDEAGSVSYDSSYYSGEDYTNLQAYLFNFDISFRLISTCFIGELLISDDGLSEAEIYSLFIIRKNSLIVKEDAILYPKDIAFKLKKKDFKIKYKYKITLNNKGQIDSVKKR
jgi:hypothetical protein